MIENIDILYDKEGDILEFKFNNLKPTIGIELNQNIILHYNQEKNVPVRIMFTCYSNLIKLKSIELSGLNEIESDKRNQVLELLRSNPLNKLLHLYSKEYRFNFLNPEINQLLMVA
ncbi:hypothetical protein H8E88_34230 [candidate division KSB1 bacterium]|nr:hypothetical protein [candidate division KSB1 bacterium]MBL7093852.1 hypothetical protein [candidate division KSB1 bacterium]